MNTAGDHRFPRATFVDPLPHGYICAGRTVDPPRHAPFVGRSTAREAALGSWQQISRQLADLPDVVSATTYRARLIPPLDGVPRHDVLLLIETTSVEAIASVQNSPPYQQLTPDVAMPARNVRRIGQTDRTTSGTFLFNHFTAADPARAVAAWEDLTGWYTSKTGVDNSTVLQPVGESAYAFVNYVRLPRGPARFLLDQFTKPSFHTFVRAKLRANDMAALPVLCEPATTTVDG